LDKHPRLHAVIAGSDSSHYGPQPSPDETWKTKALRENDLDLSRVHFVGRLPMSRYRELLRRSAVHVYLTKPFVASWSLLDAMATGCPLVVSDTEPVRELAIMGAALRVAFDKPGEIATAVSLVLSDKELTQRMRKCAREHSVEIYSDKMTTNAREALFCKITKY
jgi:glycosyltransferase involved in cell wall biosynthesis